MIYDMYICNCDKGSRKAWSFWHQLTSHINISHQVRCVATADVIFALYVFTQSSLFFILVAKAVYFIIIKCYFYILPWSFWVTIIACCAKSSLIILFCYKYLCIILKCSNRCCIQPTIDILQLLSSYRWFTSVNAV